MSGKDCAHVPDRMFRRWRRQGWSVRRISRHTGLPTSVILRRISEIWRDTYRRSVVFTDPSPEEILERAAEIRREWSPAVLKRREVGASREWKPIVVPDSIRELAAS